MPRRHLHLSRSRRFSARGGHNRLPAGTAMLSRYECSRLSLPAASGAPMSTASPLFSSGLRRHDGSCRVYLHTRATPARVRGLSSGNNSTMYVGWGGLGITMWERRRECWGCGASRGITRASNTPLHCFRHTRQEVKLLTKKSFEERDQERLASGYIHICVTPGWGWVCEPVVSM